MLLQRRDRITNQKRHSKSNKYSILTPFHLRQLPRPQTSSRKTTKPVENQKSTADGIVRDLDVQDEVWAQLQRDREATKEEQRRSEEKMTEIAKGCRANQEDIQCIG